MINAVVVGLALGGGLISMFVICAAMCFSDDDEGIADDGAEQKKEKGGASSSHFSSYFGRCACQLAALPCFLYSMRLHALVHSQSHFHSPRLSGHTTHIHVCINVRGGMQQHT